jgi:hypothetical protein
MTDAELIARLRSGDTILAEHYMNEAADRIEALTEQLAAAHQDAKEAEAYAEEVEADRKKTYEALLKVSRIHGEVEAKLATCERHRDAYAEMDRIGTQAVRDLEAKLAIMMTERDEAWKRAAHAEKMWGGAEVKLAKAVKTVGGPSSWLDRWAVHVGSCRGDTVCSCGLSLAQYEARATLAEIKGESHEALPDLR